MGVPFMGFPFDRQDRSMLAAERNLPATYRKAGKAQQETVAP